MIEIVQRRVLRIVELLLRVVRVVIRVLVKVRNAHKPARVIQRGHHRANRQKGDNRHNVLRHTGQVDQGGGPHVHVGTDEELERVLDEMGREGETEREREK
jgi:hypothetical protein